MLFEVQVKNLFILWKSYAPFARYSSFRIFNHLMIYQIWEVMMSISTWDRMHFSIYLLNHNLLSHHTWPTDRYNEWQYFSGIFSITWRTRAKFQGFLNLVTFSNYSVTSYVKIPVFHFEVNKCFMSRWISNNKKWWTSTIKNGQILLYFCFDKSQKGLELVSSLQHWSKNMLEMFFIHYTSIWPNFVLIELRIQKK